MEPEVTKETLKQIRTFQGDTAQALKAQNESLVSIQRAENIRREETQRAAPERVENPLKKTLLLALGTMVLLALASGGGWFAYKEYVRKTAPPAVVIPPNRFISANTELNVTILDDSKENLIKTIQDTAAGLETEEIRHIVLREGETSASPLLTIEKFLKLLKSRAPGSLVRSFEPMFMIGRMGGPPSSVFILIRLESFENAFSGMLQWEETLAEDIGLIFPTAEIIRSVEPGKEFEDITTKNKDARVLRDESKRTVLLYSFFDNEMLIITDDEISLRSLILKLEAEKLSR